VPPATTLQPGKLRCAQRASFIAGAICVEKGTVIAKSSGPNARRRSRTTAS
jgi:hypothetical protein